MAESAEDLTERLRREHGVAVVPGSPRWFGPGARGHVRLCFATSAGLLEEGLNRFAAGLAAGTSQEGTPPAH
jgi:aspartate/methionine/tyrosine aminotransferase